MFGNFRPAAVLGKRFTSGTTPSPTFRSPVMPLVPEDEEEENPDIPGYDANKYFDEQERIRGSRGPALTAYQQALGERPGAETNPSKWRRFGAALTGGLAGFAGGPTVGYNMASAINETPYQRSMEDYKTKVGGLRESARLEQDEIENQLKSLREARAMGLKYDEFKLKALENEHDRRMAEGNLRVAERGAATGERNAGTNQFRAATDRWAAEQTSDWHNLTANTAENAQYAQERNIDSMIQDRLNDDARERESIAARIKAAEIRSGAKNPSSSANQQGAIDNAARILSRDPKLGRYIDMSGEHPRILPDDRSPGYLTFQRELQAIVERQLFKGTPFGEPMEDVEVIVEPGRWER